MRPFVFLVIIGLFFSCKQDKGIHIKLPPLQKEQIVLKHATGFSITKYKGFTSIEIVTPWPNAKNTLKYILVNKENAAKVAFMKDAYDGIIITPIKNIVVTSTTHLPALELLQVENALVGFPGTDYISSTTIRKRIDEGHVTELGKNEGLNTETLLALQPDVVVGFGIDGSNRSLETIKQSGIPVIFNGDWVESSPLAKAEWIKFFGVLFEKTEIADSIFNSIEQNYLDAKKLAKNVSNSPTILSGAMHSDVWYLPNGTSTEAQLFKDANTNYLWNNTKGSGSLKLNFESVFVTAKNADIWLNPSNYSSYQNLENGNKNHTLFKAFQNKNIYTFTNTTGATGGVLYYELGMMRPDLVLKDIIKICHPDVLQDYKPYFFKPLE